MTGSRSWLACAALTLVGAGCGGSTNPLDGTWQTASTFLSCTGTRAYTLNGDGSLVVTETGGGACSGAWTTTGLAWAATSTEITFSGTGTCTGTVSYGSLGLTCSSSTSYTGACAYALSANDDTLTLSQCSGVSDETLTRAP
jgi:hypothetical protein